MTELQKFLFETNYSTEPENIRKKQEEEIAKAKELLKNDIQEQTKQAFQKGLAQGEQQALEKLKQELSLHIDNISQNLLLLEKYKQELYKEFESQSLLTVKHIAQNMFFKAEEIFPDKLLEQSVQNSLQNLPFCTKILIKVPSECKQYLNDIKIKEQLDSKGIKDFSIVEDSSLSPGESLIEWDKSGILSSKKDAIEKISSTFKALLEKEDADLSDQLLKENQQNLNINDSISQQRQENTTAEKIN